MRRSHDELHTNLLWSLLGTGVPLLAAIITIPRLIEAIGVARFGILSLAWVVVGYFSLFDLGLARAITQRVAQSIGKGIESEIPSIIWVGLTMMLLFSVVAAVAIWLISPWLVETKLAIPDELRGETLTTFYLLAAALPAVICSAGLRGILEAYQRFDAVNIVRIPFGALTYLAPLAVLPFSVRLPWLVAALVLTRVGTSVAYLLVCLRLYPALARRPPFRADHLRDMLSFGGWMTLSNIAGPLLLYLGRLFLAILVSAEAVAYFSTPYEMVISLLIIPGVFVSVYFPMFARQFLAEPLAARSRYRQALTYNLAVMLPLSLITYLLAKPTLAWWINPDFAEKSYVVAELLAIGVFINSFGHISQAMVQAFGRPDLTAKLHVAELILYVPYLWWLTERYGIIGAAVAWVIRVGISTVALFIIAARCQSRVSREPVPPEHRS